MPSLTLRSPAKVNLLLAITGVREDGFHDLVSLVAPLEFGDDVTVEIDPALSGDTLECDFPGVPTDGTNLALRAVAAFREVAPIDGGVRVRLEKRIPAGAGLGGGSSNASTVLLALNELCGQPIDKQRLSEISAALGSDCPLFLAGKPVIMRGRGEHLQMLSEEANASLRGRRVLVFKPGFGINTGWAYGRMKSERRWYCPPEEAEGMVSKWLADPASSEVPLFNNMEGPAFEKYLALPTVLELIRERHGLRCLMSGSGSSCLVLLEGDVDSAAVRATVLEALGDDAFCVETMLA
ncbi:MAG: 4-(cytidine 5'-diphospho)-2-C-methyl-D-erythritol kinase [Puniceicoccales bacterium]